MWMNDSGIQKKVKELWKMCLRMMELIRTGDLHFKGMECKPCRGIQQAFISSPLVNILSPIPDKA